MKKIVISILLFTILIINSAIVFGLANGTSYGEAMANYSEQDVRNIGWSVTKGFFKTTIGTYGVILVGLMLLLALLGFLTRSNN